MANIASRGLILNLGAFLLDPKPPASLLDLLSGSAMIGSYENCELAITSAYSDKTHLSFFYKTENEPNFTRPFTSTRFELLTWEVGSDESSVFHRNSLILYLGILLIEIFKEKPIERWRREEERAIVSPATEYVINLEVAHRVVKKMDNTPSTLAIKARLDLDWIPQGQPVKLEDPEMRNGLLKNVIVPLELEITMAQRGFWKSLELQLSLEIGHGLVLKKVDEHLDHAGREGSRPALVMTL
ncbi:uncharacterized protein BDR25DRAFT_310685 [Lindgomyces ingoldianus]|uniref:Uncharacterized protein n=1 Tax=Lindgomyces ingoldianus TaxID=673940 RepID=A0ACB6R949_9PLEO|nr:uncharacterized protein BDR25DRAFT_310685 [Lindgomyces ingoldianus]KAF2475270.1 hypothetical protein BDR25DRAFT_310685 [Lindgomyces ingoldianus]